MEIESLFRDGATSQELSDQEMQQIYLALQACFHPDAAQRRRGLNRLESLNAHQRSPLVSSILAHRLHEPDLDLAAQIVELIASVLTGGASQDDPEQLRTRRWLSNSLRSIGMREVDSIIRVVDSDRSLLDSASVILNQCSLAGEMLVDIFTDGRRNISHRVLALELIERVGFLETAPMIENWIHRLTNRQQRQLRMAFAPSPDAEAEALLPVLRAVMNSFEGISQVDAEI